MRILAFFCAVTSGFISNAQAQSTDALPHGDFSALKNTGSAKVIRIIDPVTLQLDDGRITSLSSLYYPDFLSQRESGPFSELAIRILKDMLLDKEVTLYQTPKSDWGRMNRMGHHIAHLERKSDQLWIQGVILSLGLAYAMTNERTPEMAGQMYNLESVARAERIGLWEEERYQPLSAESAESVLESFHIIEGTIQSTALKNNRLYLNFGKNWRTDFTVSVSPENKRGFFHSGANPLSWNARHVRVRGWIRDYNGPFMEISHREAVEFLDANKTTTDDEQDLTGKD